MELEFLREEVIGIDIASRGTRTNEGQRKYNEAFLKYLFPRDSFSFF